MRFVLFTEGHTEHKVVGPFLKRWLDPRLTQPVGVQTVRFDGWGELVREAPKRAHFHLSGPKNEGIIAVVGLLDLYGPQKSGFYPRGVNTATERRRCAIKHIESEVNHPRFRMFFAVHEVEAWLLSQPEILPAAIRKELPKPKPEEVNFNEPPAALLDRLYESRLKCRYKKVTDGTNLFGQLSPEEAYAACPALSEMLDALLMLAREAGL